MKLFSFDLLADSTAVPGNTLSCRIYLLIIRALSALFLMTICGSAVQAATLVATPIASTSVTHWNGAGTVALNGKIYTWSGYTDIGSANFNRTATLEVYDQAANTWSSAAPIPLMASSFGAFTVGGMLYSVGGEINPSGSFSSAVTRYDPSLNRWTSLKSFSRNVWDPLTIVANDSAYLMGGRAGYGATNSSVYQYDVASDSWVSRASMPNSVMGAGIASVGTKIWVIGGHHRDSESSSQLLKTVQVYDTVSNTWALEADTPFTFQWSGAVTWNNSIWVFGRNVDGSVASSIYELNLSTKQWTAHQFTAPSEVDYHSIVAIDGKAYLTQQWGGSAKTAYVVVLPSSVCTPDAIALQAKYDEGVAWCKANQAACGIVTPTSHATYDPLGNKLTIPYVDVPNAFGSPLVYSVNLSIINSDPLQFQLKSATQLK